MGYLHRAPKLEVNRKGSSIARGFAFGIVALVGAFTLGASSALAQTAAPPIKLQIPIPGLNGQFTTQVKDFGEYFLAFYIFFVGVIGILATVMAMYGGYKWITAGGNASRIAQAKESISGAVIGVVLALTSFLLLNTINPALVRVQVPNLEVIGRVGQPTSIFCDDTEAVEENGVPVLPGLRRCGEAYRIIGANAICYGWHCPQGQVCDPITDQCGPLEQVCETQQAQGDITPACAQIDLFLARSGDRANGCRTGFRGNTPQQCVFTPVIQNRNDVRVFDCDIAGAEVETPCWQNGRARSRNLQSGFTGWCAQKSDLRAGTLTDSTCALQPGTDPIRCQVNEPDRGFLGEKWYVVECSDLNINSCASPNKCWVRIDLVQHSL